MPVYTAGGKTSVMLQMIQSTRLPSRKRSTVSAYPRTAVTGILFVAEHGWMSHTLLIAGNAKSAWIGEIGIVANAINVLLGLAFLAMGAVVSAKYTRSGMKWNSATYSGIMNNNVVKLLRSMFPLLLRLHSVEDLVIYSLP
jgi:hypothetical protein